MEPRLAFVVPGEPTAANPMTAFKQGIEDVKRSEAFLLCGMRCAECGAVELFATERTDWAP